MTSLLGAKKRAEEFAAAVDGRLDTELRPEYAELVGLTGVLRAHATTASAPRAEFAATLREQLLAEAETVLVRSPEQAARQASLALPTRTHGKRERRFAVAASALVLVGGTAGMAAAAQNALPGDPLYGLKRTIEKAQTDLSRSESGKGHELLEQASTRLGEVSSLVEASASQQEVTETIEDFTVQATQGSDLLLGEFAADRNETALVEDVRTFAAANLATLQTLATVVPASGQAALADAAVALERIDAAAAAACSTCGGGAPLEAPGFFRTTADVEEALKRATTKAVQLDNTHDPLGGDTIAPVKPGDLAPAPAAGENGTPEVPEVPNPGVSGEEPVGGVVKDTVKGITESLTDTVEGVTEGLTDTVDQLLPLRPTPSPAAGEPTE